MISFLQLLFGHLSWVDAFDILIVTLIFYSILMLVRGTRADQILQGLAIVLVAGMLISSVFHLTLLNWLLRYSIPVALIALPVIFQPELRRLLEYLGRSSKVMNLPRTSFSRGTERTVDEICQATARLKDRRHPGALICIERNTGLEDYAASGVRVDALVSAELLLTIFYPNSPLHDGAVIIRGDRLIAAAVLLPLSEAQNAYADMGTRHRAALGLSEQTDALAIIISEETGTVSLAEHGRLIRNVSEDRLRRMLLALRSPGRRMRRVTVSGRIPLGATGGFARDKLKAGDRP
ncbi:MAG TPA: diadenylate cyclase CdaA [Ktedonobacterales bacterium]|nr:diadenylate cyclase CdaA [Ktedonobacterales bacterium]